MPKVISWNVLYRAYEEKFNPNSEILSTYSREEDRVAQIVSLLKEHIDLDTVACLQEVSTPVILGLVKEFEKSHRIFSYNLREDEHLVTITPKEFKLENGYSHDTSNGYLEVTNGISQVINCHLLPQRYTKKNILEYLCKMGNTKRDTFIAGDFNELHSKVKEKLQGKFTCPYYGRTYKHKAIDQIVFNAKPSEHTAQKINQVHISDHHMILLDFQL
jgi:hypothetical protein